MTNIVEILQAGVAHHQNGNLAQAAASYEKVLSAAPQHFDALHLLGVARMQQGRTPEAVQYIRQAIAQNDRIPAAQFNLALALAANGQNSDAVAAFDRVLAATPQSAEAWEGRGNSLVQLGRFTDALASFDQRLALAPTQYAALFGRGSALAGLERYAEAVAAWQAAAQMEPHSVVCLASIGHVLTLLSKHSEAIDYLLRALDLDPRLIPALQDFMTCAEHLYRREEAGPLLDRAIAAEPDNSELLYLRGTWMLGLGRVADASATLDAAASLDAPCKILAETLFLRRQICDWKDDELEQRLISRIEQGDTIEPRLAMSLFDDPYLILQNARNSFTRRFPSLPSPKYRGTPYRHDRIRVAYLSSDYRAHIAGAISVDLFERHDRNDFEIIGLSFGPNDFGELRNRIVKSFDQFHDVANWSDEQIATWMADNEVDVAVDLTGHCELGRPGIMAYRGAPAQVGYLGYPLTRGEPYVDYVLSDAYTTPPAECQKHYVENIVTLPDCCLVMDSKRPDALSAPTKQVVGLPEAGFVFCYFGQPFKISPEVFAVWMRLLKRVPGSVLWLRSDTEVTYRKWRAAALAQGVDPGRLVLAPKVSGETHLARHALADLFLDTPFFNGITTSVDALWAGLPVLTCSGRTFLARHGGSVLLAADLPDLVTTSLEEYEAMAYTLATDGAKLRAIRQRIGRARHGSRLFDMNRTRRNIENAYRTMVEITAAGQPTRPFTVAAIQ